MLPGDGLKEEEPIEPYQKIGPSKADALHIFSSCSLNNLCHVIQYQQTGNAELKLEILDKFSLPGTVCSHMTLSHGGPPLKKKSIKAYELTPQWKGCRT